MTPAGLLIASSLCTVVVACGGSTSSSSESQQQFTDTVNTLCSNATTSLNAVPQPSISSVTSPQQSDLSAISTYLSAVSTQLQSLDTKLKDLGTPPAKQSAWSQALGAVDTVISDAQSAQSAAHAADLQSYDTAYGKFVNDASLLDQAFGGFGAAGCTSANSSSASPPPS